MRVIISLKKAVRVQDEHGNDYTVNQIAGDVTVSSNGIQMQPTQYQMRDGINKKANEKAAEANQSREMFVLSQQEIAADEELAVLLEQVKARVTVLYQAKLEAI